MDNIGYVGLLMTPDLGSAHYPDYQRYKGNGSLMATYEIMWPHLTPTGRIVKYALYRLNRAHRYSYTIPQPEPRVAMLTGNVASLRLPVHRDTRSNLANHLKYWIFSKNLGWCSLWNSLPFAPDGRCGKMYVKVCLT